MITCSVYGCNNNTLTSDPNIQYYYFPKHPNITQQWINACMWRVDQIDTNTSRICSIHFDADSYANEYKMHDYLGCYTKVLKYDAVPTLYLPQPVVIKATFEENVHVEEEPRKIKDIIVYNVANDSTTYTAELFNNEKTEENININNVEENHVNLNQVEEQLLDSIKTQRDYLNLVAENERLANVLLKLQRSFNNLEESLKKKTEYHKTIEIEYRKCRKKYYAAENQSRSFDEQLRILSKVFSESQIKILSGKKKIYWSNDDMAMGYTIRHMSNKRCYIYLSKTLNIPLPALSSIKRWVTLKKSEFDKIQKKEETCKEEESD